MTPNKFYDQVDSEGGAAFMAASYDEWHRRLAHCSMEAVKSLAKSDAVNGMLISTTSLKDCKACMTGKICRVNHPPRYRMRADGSFAILHIDTVGPLSSPSIGRSRYFILATEEHSKYKLFETTSSEAEILARVKKIILKAALESPTPVRAIVTNNGSEFANSELEEFLNSKGIMHLFSAAYTPEQNGLAERANRIVLEGVRTLLHEAKLPARFWAEALNTFVYTTNRVPGKGQCWRTQQRATLQDARRLVQRNSPVPF